MTGQSWLASVLNNDIAARSAIFANLVIAGLFTAFESTKVLTLAMETIELSASSASAITEVGAATVAAVNVSVQSLRPTVSTVAYCLLPREALCFTVAVATGRMPSVPINDARFTSHPFATGPNPRASPTIYGVKMCPIPALNIAVVTLPNFAELG